MSKNVSPKAKTVPKKKPKKKRRFLWLKILWIFFFTFLLFTGGFTAALWYYMPRIDLSKLDVVSLPTKVYDRYGHLAFIIPATGITNVPLSEIPKTLQQALIATEDAGFYQNHGFSLRGYARAALHDLFHLNTGQGASTITQQLAKIVYLKDNHSIKYKLEELLFALQISNKFTKNQILDMYFNHVFFGNNATGIAQAAYNYFDLKPSTMERMTLPQAALLAGLPQAPSYYDPIVNPQIAIARRNEVLQRMETQKYITYSQMVTAQAAPLELHAPPASTSSGVPVAYDYYRDYIDQELSQLPISASQLAQGGLQIYTSLNPKLQDATYQGVNNPSNYPTPLSTATEKIEGAAVFVNPHTGGIQALVGGTQNQYTFRGFDYATSTQRSPGSAMKPLIAYGPAIATGNWNAGSALNDGIHNQLSFGTYTVSDWENHPTFRGYVSLRWALAESWNAPAVWLLQQIGIQQGINFAQNAGIDLSNPANQNLTIALGNIVPGISPLQLADAYAAFDNNGTRIPAHAIDRIVASDGTVLYQFQATPITVMSPSTASQMVALLRNNVTNGIVAGASVPGHEVAGKTGSVAYTNTSHTDSDLWVAAFTPNIVGAVWEGYPVTTLANSLPQWSSSYPPKMFANIISNGLPPTGATFNVSPATGSDFPAQIP